MGSDQTKLLLKLVKKIKSEPKVRDKVVATLTSAKIITAKENLTSHYSNLRKVIATSK